MNKLVLDKFAKEEWGDKVKIVAVSIDKDAETVSKLIEERGW